MDRQDCRARRGSRLNHTGAEWTFHCVSKQEPPRLIPRLLLLDVIVDGKPDTGSATQVTVMDQQTAVELGLVLISSTEVVHMASAEAVLATADVRIGPTRAGQHATTL